MQVVRPVTLLTLSLPDRHGTAVPSALVTVHVAVPLGCPAPGAAAVTKAAKFAPCAVKVGLVREEIVTAEGAALTVSAKGDAFATLKSLEPS